MESAIKDLLEYCWNLNVLLNFLHCVPLWQFWSLKTRMSLLSCKGLILSTTHKPAGFSKTISVLAQILFQEHIELNYYAWRQKTDFQLVKSYKYKNQIHSRHQADITGNLIANNTFNLCCLMWVEKTAPSENLTSILEHSWTHDISIFMLMNHSGQIYTFPLILNDLVVK